MASLLARAASGFSTRLTRGKNEEGRLATPPTAKQRAYSLRFPLPPSTHDSRESTPPSHYPYHPNGKEAGRTGYVGSLTEDQVKAIMTIKSSLHTQSPDLWKQLEDQGCGPGESVDHVILRFLRARKFKVGEALAMLREDLEWRRDKGVAALAHVRADEVLGCPEMVVLAQLPHWCQGHDKAGRPVVYKDFGRCNVKAMLQHTPQESLEDYHVWCQEKYVGLLRRHSQATGHLVETLTFIIDAKGWNVGLATRQAYTFLKRMVCVDNLHYPERLDQLIIVNAPTTLSMAWRIISGWLDPATTAKIRIIGGGPKQYRQALTDLIDHSQLCDEYGGALPSRRPKVFPTSFLDTLLAEGAGDRGRAPTTIHPILQSAKLVYTGVGDLHKPKFAFVNPTYCAIPMPGKGGEGMHAMAGFLPTTSPPSSSMRCPASEEGTVSYIEELE